MEVTIPDVLQPVLEIYGLQATFLVLAAMAVYYGVPYVKKMIGVDLVYGIRTDLIGVILGVVAYAGLAKPTTVVEWLVAGLGGGVSYGLAAGKFKADQAKSKGSSQ